MSKAGISLLAFLFLLMGVIFPTQAQDLDQDLKPLIPLKTGHPKLETSLSRIADSFEKGDVAGAEQRAEALGILVRGRSRVIIMAKRKMDVIPELEALGVKIEGSYQDMIQGLAPLGILKSIAEIPGINFIRPPNKPFPLVTSQGVALTGADVYHAAGVTGQNAKIAVLDLGFSGYSSLLGTELPSSVTAKSFYGDPTGEEGDITGGGEVHGTACAEVVYDMAPGVQALYLVNHNSSVEFANAVDWLIAQDVDIISYSVGWVNAGPYDGTGYICDKVDDAHSNGILWVNSAGNQAQRHYEGTFTDTDSDDLHEYNTSPIDETININASQGTWITAFLSWNDWPYTDQDYDLYLLDDNLDLVDSSENSQTGTQPPAESIEYQAKPSDKKPYHLVVGRISTTQNHYLEIYSFRNNFQDNVVTSSSLLIPADSANSFTAGATYWNGDILESFSSRGPTNGPGGGPTGGTTKPDTCGPDGVSNATYGSFGGTSAAAPHVAGAAGLLITQFPSYTVDQIQSVLEGWAVDLGDSGMDNLYGWGRLQLDDEPTMVMLSSFAAIPADGKVVLVWRTECEANNVGFAVYRRDIKDGNYVRIAFVKGAQDSETSSDYQFTDEQAQPGHAYYYHLEDVDVSGKRGKSDPIRVELPAPPSDPTSKQIRLKILPARNSLFANYPNPFNPETWIPYQLARDADVVIRIYNMTGQLIRTLDLGRKRAGYYINRDKAAYWDGNNEEGEFAASGVYFYTIQAGDFVDTSKMMIVE